MKLKKGDLIEAFAKGKVNVLCHCCNRQNTFGSGFAKQLKETYPEAYEVDKVWYGKGKVKDNQLMARDLSAVKLSKNSMIVNLYGQEFYGTEKRQLDYGMFSASLCSLAISMSQAKNLNREIQDWIIGFPYKIGCDREGGDWKVVKEMIDYVFKDYQVKIYKLSEKKL